ncbi:MAG: RNA polymerase subunit sigma-24 [Actinomycetota bacterium]|nr:RNA polymerase subunit sigma-24 [Actinomycetota bacterium]
MPAPDPRRSAETVWRMESSAVVAAATRVLGDISLGEEVAQDAFVAALEQWPRDGVPPNPAGWLVTTARHQAVDLVRRRVTYARKLAEVGRSVGAARLDAATEGSRSVEEMFDDRIGDDLLRLVFTTCHPILTPESRVALTLRLLGGLTTAEVARGLLLSESTAAQRISRAKRTLAREGIAFDLPAAAQMPERLASVLDVVYLVFNEGYVATSGTDWVRPELCHEAIRLARLLTALLPGEREVLALDALLELQASRLPARVDAAGAAVLLPDQDRSHWDRLLIRRGQTLLARALAMPGPPTPYLLQASIAACHAVAPTAIETDWRQIAQLYAGLVRVSPSPIVQLNRAVAVGMAGDPAQGLALVDELTAEPPLQAYPQLPAVRAHLLQLSGRDAEAAAAYQLAAERSRNQPERELFARRAAGSLS